MSDSFLSRAEIDLLLNGENRAENSSSEDKLNLDANIKPYDPNTQRRVIRERLHSLEIINERFARQFRSGLFNLSRRSPDVTVGGIKIQPYHEFARNLPVPTNLNLVHLNPLRGLHYSFVRLIWSLLQLITCLAGMVVFRQKLTAVNSPRQNNA